ncbi:exodeoxyribonuclease V subunit beta [Uliginosibacterium paludis]|uniref:RecBCD enzyme subunit RecB n=1 Tax=Uliginosibacterium paludis TaxID=1615952 RepID=A0ABV2CUE4_9RHOO
MQPDMQKTLDALSFPLTGSHLIEASAGTGKTFTIAMLYLRLVLGHGSENAFRGGALTPPEILVVTFTEAATRELRDRIRVRLTEAAEAFRRPERTPDPALCALRSDYPEADWPACASRLELAAEWMDEAAVSTIHAWCNRMLREHAFDSQSLFSQELETDQSEMLAQTVRDYWRRHFYPLDRELLIAVLEHWQSPDELEKAVRPLLPHVDQLPAADAPAIALPRLLAARRKALGALKAPWAAWLDEVEALLAAGRAGKRFNGSKLRSDTCANWLAGMREWAGSAALALPELTAAQWNRFTPEGIAEAWPDGTPAHPAFDAFAGLRAAIDALPATGPTLLAHAARSVSADFARLQARRARIGFDQLLTGLDAALQGPNGMRLAEVIRQQFPVALIDEFQDTDPIQYRIFDRVYEVAADRTDSALILIGDPKQAIYAFRGADIHTYLTARRAVADRLYTLDTNFRSTLGMVAAANQVFSLAESRDAGPAAFRFRHAGGNAVPFYPVRARGRPELFVTGGQEAAALTLALAPPPKDECWTNKADFLACMARACAHELAELLSQAAEGRAGFRHPDTGFTQLRPGDVAILVNNGGEARELRQALARHGIRSVYLSDKDTVYSMPQAQELHFWLLACASPDNDRALRAALATPSLGLEFAELEALNLHEDRWEARVLQFKAYRELWQKQGVLPMVHRILSDFGCAARLLAPDEQASAGSGERVLTDLLHLAELLQQASFALDGEHALIRFLAEQIAAPEGDAEGRKLRLESDEALVKVVTIHKSKGLEYPVVFLPTLPLYRPVKAGDTPLRWHDEASGTRIVLQATDDIVMKADEERIGEDVRKTYVALTRARHHTWLGLGALSLQKEDLARHGSAIGYLLGLNGLGHTAMSAALQAFVQNQPALALREIGLPDAPLRVPAEPRSTSGHARRMSRAVREHWWVSSYSALRVEGHAPQSTLAEDSPAAENLLEPEHLPAPRLGAPRPDRPVHRFFKGAEAGTFLHEIMEWATQQGFASALANPEALRDTLARRCRLRGWEAWVEPLTDWTLCLLDTPLQLGPQGPQLRLASLPRARAEMEFWFEASHVPLATLDELIIQATLGSAPRPRLLPDQLNGMLKGFMDLVFEHEGRYYVADYKSNWLGPTDADYTPEAMHAAIRSHRYDLQYVIYLFALHRLLRSRLPDYDYERHIGGAVYLFLRGIHADSAGVHFERPPATLMDQLDALFTGESAGAHA